MEPPIDTPISNIVQNEAGSPNSFNDDDLDNFFLEQSVVIQNNNLIQNKAGSSNSFNNNDLDNFFLEQPDDDILVLEENTSPSMPKPIMLKKPEIIILNNMDLPSFSGANSNFIFLIKKFLVNENIFQYCKETMYSENISNMSNKKLPEPEKIRMKYTKETNDEIIRLARYAL